MIKCLRCGSTRCLGLRCANCGALMPPASSRAATRVATRFVECPACHLVDGHAHERCPRCGAPLPGRAGAAVIAGAPALAGPSLLPRPALHRARIEAAPTGPADHKPSELTTSDLVRLAHHDYAAASAETAPMATMTTVAPTSSASVAVMDPVATTAPMPAVTLAVQRPHRALGRWAALVLVLLLGGAATVAWSIGAHRSPLSLAGSVVHGVQAAVQGPSWREAQAVAPPAARSHASAVWDPTDSELLVYGGSLTTTIASDLWLYDPDTQTWRQVTDAGTGPGPRVAAAAAWDTAQNELLLFGGTTGPFTMGNDVWAYSLSANSWTELNNGSGTAPSPREGAAVAWDATNRLLLLFGGSGSPGVVGNDLWAYDPVANTWRQLQAASAVQPSPRAPLTAAWDAATNVFYVYQGAAISRYSSTLWSYNVTAGVWQRAPAVGAPSASLVSGAAWATNRRQLVVWGGAHCGLTSCLDNDLWTYSAATQQWALLKGSTLPGPAPRSGAITVWDSGRDQLLVFGGGQAGAFLDSAWTFPLHR